MTDKETKPFSVDEKKLEYSLGVLAESASELGTRIADVRWLERKIKIAKADAFISAQGSSVAEREAMALTNADYIALSDQIRLEETKLEILRARRSMAEITIEVFRTLEASKRRGNL